jgi:glycosyltransferase involved in cell wall biosynthesis
MFISVVIPCYNSEATIRECILSIKNQDYQGEYEIVVVDNGSTDCTVDIIKSLGVNKIVMSPNTTVYAARNNAILQSKGEVLALIDSDCVAQKNWLTTGVNAIKYCDVIAGKILPKKSKNKLLYNYDKYVLWSDNDKYKKSKNIAAGNAFIKRKVFDDIGGFIEEYRTAGDSIFSLEARNKGYEIKYTQDPWHYERRRGSIN